MKKIIITPKYDSIDMEELLEFASDTYKIGMQCNKFNDSTIIFKTLNESDFPFYISNLRKNTIVTNNGIYIYNKGTFRSYQIELQDDEYYLEKDKCYQVDTVDGYFPIFIALKTEIYKSKSSIYVQELVSHQSKKTFPKNTHYGLDILNIVELSPLEYILHKQSILSGTEPTRQQLDSLKDKSNISLRNTNIALSITQKEITNLINTIIEPSMSTSKINNSILIQLDNSKINELQLFSIKLELDSLNTKSNRNLNPLN